MSGIVQTFRQLRSQGIEGYFAIKYAQFAKDTPAMREAYANVAEQVATVMREGTLLEVGPGPAFISIEIARYIPHAQIIGLDISETMIGIARRNVVEAGLSTRITFRQGDAAEMPFDDATFDFVVSSGSLHHWSKPVAVFDEIYRVLKPGKPAVVYDVRKDAPKEKIDEFSRQIKSWFMRWGLRHSIGESYTQQGIDELLVRTRFKKADQIDLDDLGMFMWLKKPASLLS